MTAVLSINAGQDLAGIGIRLKQAFDRHAPDWSFHSVVMSQTYLDYPIDRPWGDARDLWDLADIVHLHNNFRTAEILETGRKPSVIHHHGTFFRQNVRTLLRQSRKRHAVGIASTLDLYLVAPDELEWVPAPYDVEWLANLRRPIHDGLIRIATAPTDRAIKSTDAFLAAIGRLTLDYPIELVLIERSDWATCLRRKATADIFFDQVLLGYGCNAVEAMGMGIPVVAGAADSTLREYERRFRSMPFYEATEGSIYEALRDLIESPGLRSEYGRRGRDHVARWHADDVVVRQMQTIYERVLTRVAP